MFLLKLGLALALTVNNCVVYFFFLGTLQAIVKECVAGASVKEICQKGDNMLMHDTGKVSFV